MDIGTTLVRNARRTPHKTAIHYGEKTYSYVEFNREVNKLANGLVSEVLKKAIKSHL